MHVLHVQLKNPLIPVPQAAFCQPPEQPFLYFTMKSIWGKIKIKYQSHLGKKRISDFIPLSGRWRLKLYKTTECIDSLAAILMR